MSRVFRRESLHSQRQRLLKRAAYTLRLLLGRTQRDAEARDMVAYLALLLDDVHRLVDTTATSWEKKGFWLKADRFRLDWAWVPQVRDMLYRALLNEDWDAMAQALARLYAHVSQVKLPKTLKPKEPWKGAWQALQERVRRQGLHAG